MQLLAFFHITNLIIWVPGLLFLLAVIYTLRHDERGGAPRRLLQATLGLFVLSLVVAYLVPRYEINQAIEFAQAYDPESEVTEYAEIPFAAKNAYYRPSEAGPAQQSSGDDMFDFSQGADSGATQTQAAEEPATATITYHPERGVSWFLLVVFLITGCIFFVQGPRVLGTRSRAAG